MMNKIFKGKGSRLGGRSKSKSTATDDSILMPPPPPKTKSKLGESKKLGDSGGAPKPSPGEKKISPSVPKLEFTHKTNSEPRLVSLASHNSPLYGVGGTPSPRTLTSQESNLIKKQAVEEVRNLLENEFHFTTYDESTMKEQETIIEELKNVAERFLSEYDAATTPRTAVTKRDGQTLMKEIQNLYYDNFAIISKNASLSTFTLKLMYIISNCSRFEEYRDLVIIGNNTPKGLRKRPQSSLIDHQQLEKLNAEIAKMNVGNIGNIATPQPPPPTLPNEEEIDREAFCLCRICEEYVPYEVLSEHSSFCVIRNKWHIRSLAQEFQMKEHAKKMQQKSDETEFVAISGVFKAIQELSERASTTTHDESGKGEINKILSDSKSLIKHLDSSIQSLKELEKMVKKKRKAINYTNTVAQSSPSEVSFSPRISTPRNKIPMLSDFEIIKPITKGGFGKVYLTKKKRTGDIYAMKLMNKSELIKKNQSQHVVAERNILASVSCPYVVKMYFAFETMNYLCLVMEYCSGGDLFSMLDEIGPFEENVARTYIAETVLALEYLHSKSIIHRDIKPDNLLLTSTGHVKLTDFGLSKYGLLDSATINSRRRLHAYKKSELKSKRDRLNSCVGTPEYLSPEVLMGMGHGFEVDWWAVGILLYEFLAGVTPFIGNTPEEIFQSIVQGNIFYPEDVSPEAQDLIGKLLQPKPEQRLGHCGSEEIKRHPFFKEIDWDNVTTQEPPFVPKPVDPYDTSYFDARKQYWNMDIPEDDISAITAAMEDANSTSSFGAFWFISGPNLKDMNERVVDSRINEVKTRSRTYTM